jgi:hypothetical protein
MRVADSSAKSAFHNQAVLLHMTYIARVVFLVGFAVTRQQESNRKGARLRSASIELAIRQMSDTL